MFTVEEITLLKMYGGEYLKREAVLANLEKVGPFLSKGDKEMEGLVKGLAEKLYLTSDKAFKKIDYRLAIDTDDIGL